MFNASVCSEQSENELYTRFCIYRAIYPNSILFLYEFQTKIEFSHFNGIFFENTFNFIIFWLINDTNRLFNARVQLPMNLSTSAVGSFLKLELLSHTNKSNNFIQPHSPTHHQHQFNHSFKLECGESK